MTIFYVQRELEILRREMPGCCRRHVVPALSERAKVAGVTQATRQEPNAS